MVPRFVQENALIAAGLLFFLRMHPSAAEAKNIASYRAVGVFSKRVGYQYSTFGADCGLSILAPNSTAQVDDVPTETRIRRDLDDQPLQEDCFISENRTAKLNRVDALAGLCQDVRQRQRRKAKSFGGIHAESLY